MKKIDGCFSHGHDIYLGPRQRICRTCDNKRSQERFKNNSFYRMKHMTWLKKRYEFRKEIIARSKMKPCMDCGIQYNPWVMQYDHKEGFIKKFTIGQKGRMFSVEKIKDEISKCDVVCANCHSERTHKRLPMVMSTKKKINKYPVVSS